MSVPAAPVETSAHDSDRTRARKPDRPWYAYAARLLPAARDAGRWADLGCGQGEFLEQTGEAGHQGVGLDFWPPNAVAATRAGHPSLAADLNHALPFRDEETYDRESRSSSKKAKKQKFVFKRLSEDE